MFPFVKRHTHKHIHDHVKIFKLLGFSFLYDQMENFVVMNERGRKKELQNNQRLSRIKFTAIFRKFDLNFCATVGRSVKRIREFDWSYGGRSK